MRTRRNGTTLVEVSMAVLITTIMVIVVMSSYSYARALLLDRGNERLAMNLARAELEKTLAFAYTGIVPGSDTYSKSVGDLNLQVTRDIAEYRYDYGTSMTKVTGPVDMPASISDIPFDTNWTHPTVSDGLRFRLIRLTAEWNSNSVYYQQLISEGWRE